MNRDVNNLCAPEDGFYNKSGQKDAEPCVFPCKHCTSESNCTRKIDFYHFF